MRFAFYGRISTDGYQDPASSRQWQFDIAAELADGRGCIAVEFFDAGYAQPEHKLDVYRSVGLRLTYDPDVTRAASLACVSPARSASAKPSPSALPCHPGHWPIQRHLPPDLAIQAVVAAFATNKNIVDESLTRTAVTDVTSG
jgi:hypothetical protein